ncbi:MAG TPA: ECF transporter S component [Candidatus Bathyarchaeia archaeon]|nr:ECF transporter S component [Candidatus Bathyarchaeia archaeon]
MGWKRLRNSLNLSSIKSMIVGMTLYGVLTIPFNTMWIPRTGLVALRPTVVIPILFSFLFGPVVGFATGLFGNLISDFFSFGSFFWNWDIGTGLIGLVAGIGYFIVRKEDRGKSRGLILSIILSVVGSFVGIGFATATDYLFGIGMISSSMALAEFATATLTDAINGGVLTPILLCLYLLLCSRREN